MTATEDQKTVADQKAAEGQKPDASEAAPVSEPAPEPAAEPAAEPAPKRAPRAYTSSRGISGNTQVATLLGREVRQGLNAEAGDVVVGWGFKENTEKARDYARKRELEFWSLEDGFLGYMSHPSVDDRRLSMVVDKSGIYYNAHSPSDLEIMLNMETWITPQLIKRAESAMARIRRWRLSKYNHAPFELSDELTHKLAAFKGPKVLVVDQTYGDRSIVEGMGSDDMFQDMLRDALAENPTALVIVKVHPDVLAGTKEGHFNVNRKEERVLYVAEEATPHALLDKVDQVYVVTSQMGFEGLIAGKKVTCYGLPFYAGWGLTHDKQFCEARIANRTLAELFAAAYIEYTRYIDPFTNERCEIERVLDLLVAERQMARPSGRRVYAAGFSLWKRGFLPEFFGPTVKETKFVTPCSLEKLEYEAGDMVVVWGRKHDEEAKSVPAHIPVWRMEDGFLRSVGLGSDLKRPSSLVLDRAGIYYDGPQPSDLETFLETHEFDKHDLARGKALREQVLNAKVSKYNVGEKGMLDFRARSGGREVILVPGQVEDDASIMLGSPEIKTNADLLTATRDAKPDAYLIYKPHPDVASGNREGAVPQNVLDYCVNEVVEDADIIDVLDAVDGVHTMTSLTGFEALMRGKQVTTYGMPFYAGWGLTEDACTFERRTRKLELDGLVYGLLCVYARYVKWPEGLSYSPEALVADIAANARSSKIKAGPFTPIRRLARKAVYIAQALRR